MLYYLIIKSFLFLFLASLLPTFSLDASTGVISEQGKVLEYWFGNLSDESDYPYDRMRIWFNGGNEVDKEIRNRFSKLVNQAASGKLDDWQKTPRGRLALIILLDQFTRNIYRNTPQAFAYDDLARRYVFDGLVKGDDKKLFPVERAFFYLPMKHAENRDLQYLSVALFKQLLDDSPSSLKDRFAANYDYALRHKVIIDRFGRFPHRNAILGRESTPEELEFLTQPGSSF